MLTEKLDILNIFNELSEKTELFEKTGLQFVQTRVYMQQLNSDNFIQNRRIAVATIRSGKTYTNENCFILYLYFLLYCLTGKNSAAKTSVEIAKMRKCYFHTFLRIKKVI